MMFALLGEEASGLLAGAVGVMLEEKPWSGGYADA
jgi:hypothetical protein